MIPRFKYIYNFHVYFWAWNIPLGAYRYYYDAWCNQINFGFVCFVWNTPPLIKDEQEFTNEQYLD